MDWPYDRQKQEPVFLETGSCVYYVMEGNGDIE